MNVKLHCPHKNLHMKFIPALFIFAKTWKQPRHPSVGKWRNKLWYIQTMEYCSALKRNELSSHKKHTEETYMHTTKKPI